MIGKEILNDSSFTNTLRAEMKSKIKKSQSIILKKCFSSALGYSLEIEHALDLIYQQLDLLLSYKRRYKHLKFVFWIFPISFLIHLFDSSLIVNGYDEQPNYRQSLLKQIFDLFKRHGNSGSSSTTQQEQLMHDIEHVPFDGFTDFFKSAARG